jgi:glycosyltransferase involved in cell wall biosynthesis
MLDIQLIGNDNGAGLTRDMRLIERILRERGHHVTVTKLNNRARLSHRWQRLSGRLRQYWRKLRKGKNNARYDINLMCESVSRAFFHQADSNVLFPHPEWFKASWLPDVGSLDLVLAKTHHAQRIFSELGCRVVHTGFTSEDCLDTTVARQQTFFHGPGRSANKGAARLAKLWSQHPEWPLLTMVWRGEEADQSALPPNVRLIRDYLDERALREIQNSSVFHLCPSQTEGYGHSLVESLSTGAVTISVDAEPMNELITSERGVLVPAHAHGQQELATLYDFDMEGMRAAIERCIAMPADEQRTLGSSARAWYEANRDAFPRRLLDALNRLSTFS